MAGLLNPVYDRYIEEISQEVALNATSCGTNVVKMLT